MSKILEFVKKKLHSDRFVSLNLKLTIVILLAAGLTVAVLGACSLLQTVVTKNVFQADFMKKKFVDRRYEELKTYIRDNGVKSTDKELLEEWMDDKKYTELIVYNSKGQVFSGGWIVDSDGTVSGDGVNLVGKQSEDTRSAQPRIENKPKIDTQHFTRDTFNRIIRFRDNSCYVYMNVYYEQAWIRFILIVSIILAVLTFFLVILKYNKAVLRRAFDIAADVKRISDGDMDSQVTVGPHDELGELAESVNRMQQALKERSLAEQAAKDANAQLITSMSHDIRTPLTSLIGYLDIIDSGRFETLEDLSRYIKSCRDKAFQLKGLSDKLFNYFLVFGAREEDPEELEVVDAGILFRQLLAEHISEIIDYDYDTNFNYQVPEQVMIRTDISGIQRVFDNLFSNIMKYANPDFNIEIKANVINGKIKLILQNHITEEAKKVESTKIGVKTCKKIIEDTGGSFHAMEEEKIYTTEILIPILSEAETQIAIAEQEEEEAAEAEAKAEAEEEENAEVKAESETGQKAGDPADGASGGPSAGPGEAGDSAGSPEEPKLRPTPGVGTVIKS